jgi:mono/diheme cytochrome c family protein
MKILLKIVGVLLVVVVLVAVGGVAYLKLAFPKVSAATDLKIQSTPELVERGRYLANHVAVCIDCHSTRNWDHFAGPIIAGTEGKGGEAFIEGFPGELYSKNITPAALGTWTDGEVLRAFTAGVNRDGRPLFPLMPYLAYGRMAREDAEAIVAYLRTLAPIQNEVPARKLGFPLNILVETMPQDAEPQPIPPASDTVAYGRYLTNAAACAECHTPQEKGKPVPGMELAGGFEFPMPEGTNRSVNITPDDETGIGGWSREFFIQRFKQYEGKTRLPLDETRFNSVMPWVMYAGMTEQDLGAIYDFLRTLTPVKNKVERWTRKGT